VKVGNVSEIGVRELFVEFEMFASGHGRDLPNCAEREWSGELGRFAK
jgi:hypothetical protein